MAHCHFLAYTKRIAKKWEELIELSCIKDNNTIYHNVTVTDDRKKLLLICYRPIIDT